MRVCAEIDNYGSILEAMEAKVIESEERARIAEKARDVALGEMNILRQKFK